MAHQHHTRRLAETEEALIILFCLIDDAYAHLNPRGARRYESLKRLADSEVITLALFQQLRGVESERSFLRDVQRFFSQLFPGVVGLHPSSFHRRVRKLRRFLEPLRREVLSEMVGDPETLLVDSTLLSVLHPLLRFPRARASPEARGYAGEASASTGSSCTSSVPPMGSLSPTSSLLPTLPTSLWPRNSSTRQLWGRGRRGGSWETWPTGARS